MTRILSRREFVAFAAAALGGLAAGGFAPGRYNDAWTFEVSDTEILFPSLPEQFDSYRIGFLSDIHFGLWMPESLIRDAVQALNQADPDLILLGGDFILVENHSPRLSASWNDRRSAGIPLAQMPHYCIDSLVPLMAGLSARDGVYAVPGNHDRWYLHDAELRDLERAGLRFLLNESIAFSRGNASLQLSGTDDFWTGVPRLSLPARRENGQTFRILLSHNPDFISQTLRTDYEFDLALSGHTHGGQIVIPWLGALHYNVRDRRLASGLYLHPRAKVFTTRGLGTVEIPLRLNCPAEVSIITLRKGIPA